MCALSMFQEEETARKESVKEGALCAPRLFTHASLELHTATAPPYSPLAFVTPSLFTSNLEYAPTRLRSSLAIGTTTLSFI